MKLDPKVKWIFASDTNQQRPALCVIHDGKMLCVQAGAIVRTLVRRASEFAGSRNVSESDHPYPVSKAVAKLDEVSRRIGITQTARIILDAIEKDDDSLLGKTKFKDEEGLTMRVDGDDVQDGADDAEASTPPTKSKRLPPPRKKAPPVKATREEEQDDDAGDASESDNKTDATPVKGKEKEKMATKKSKGKPAKKAAKKSAAKSAPAKKQPAAAGEGGFRAGSNMEKGFIAYKADRAKYQKFERGDKQEWAQKLADKLGTTLNSVRTMISKNWEPLLSK